MTPRVFFSRRFFFWLPLEKWKDYFSLACSTEVWSEVVQGGVRVKANKAGVRNKEGLFWLEEGGVIMSMKVVVVECE